MYQSNKTKLLVIIGYGLIVGVAIFGIVWIYKELVRFSDAFEPPKQRKELVILSNTLATLYHAEGTGGLLAIATDPNLLSEYDALMVNVFQQIDSLEKVSQETYLDQHLDSLKTLLLKKQANTNELVHLMRLFETSSVKEITNTTVLTSRDLDKLDNLLVNNIQQSKDTSVVVGEKKGFFRKLGDAFKSNKVDTMKQISSHSDESSHEIELATIKDTIVDFIRQINDVALKKNTALFVQLMQKQNELYGVNEKTTAQINEIMDELEVKERENVVQLLNMRTQTVERSSIGVSIIALAAILLAVLFMSWVLREITKNQRLQREIEDGKKNVERLLASREQLMFSITHDIKAPISSIIGYLELIMKDKPTSQITYYIENMQQSASHIMDLVRNLLELHSLDANQQKIEQLSFCPAILLRDIYESFIPIANKKDLKFEYSSDLSNDENYQSDPYLIRQVVNNILSNATKYTPSNGKVSMSARLVTKKKEKTELHLEVKDTGPGIKESDKERIFKEFERLEYSGTDIEGTGLGLSITNKLVRLLGGSIAVDSVFNEGSVFKVMIPLSNIIIEEETPVKETVMPEIVSNGLYMSMGQARPIKKKRVKLLFIDDDVVQLNLYSELLKREGMLPRVCSGSLDALRLLQNEHFDIIFSDIQMPDMNGFELAERIRMSNIDELNTIPIVGLSANSQLDKSKYEEAGFNEFLSKPFTPNQLLQIIFKYTSNGNEIKTVYPAKSKGFVALIQFAGDDPEAAQSIIRSFIEENNKNRIFLAEAFEREDWECVRKIAHKMLPLMRMISARRIVTLLQDYETGETSKENIVPLLNGIRQKIKEAEHFLEQYMVQHSNI
ncbi:hybrid sensor histidine kinase/response regulator [Bacteroidia bacterium]|nr:hybrid sensor histidine kinase/response regulator [Bacteroidia bacterium]